jgi:hypothetical protein
MRMPEGSQPEVLARCQKQGNAAAAFGLAAGPQSKKCRSAIINQMVSSRFRYVLNRGRASFPAHRPNGRSCSTIFLLSSTEV